LAQNNKSGIEKYFSTLSFVNLTLEVLLSIIRGSISWLVISNLATISSVLVTIYSGSILTTEEFGAVGLIMLVINVLESLKQLGVKEYLIATDKVENRVSQRSNIVFYCLFYCKIL
jgi:hypothetical protein